MKFSMIQSLVAFNNHPYGFHPLLQYLYLMFNRPIFTAATAMAIMPFLLNNPYLYPMRLFLQHSFWFLPARLSYGAYLFAGTFMLFLLYDQERGTWASQFNCYMYWFAIVSVGYMLSFILTVVIEMPCHNLFKEFVLEKSEVPVSEAYYQTGSGAAPASGQRTKRKGSQGDGSPLLEDGTESLDTEVSSPKGLGFASNSTKKENFVVNEDMAFEDERELEQDPEMKDIYFLKSSLTQQEPQQKAQRRGLGIIGND